MWLLPMSLIYSTINTNTEGQTQINSTLKNNEGPLPTMEHRCQQCDQGWRQALICKLLLCQQWQQ